jgi:uncharacterized protein (DUF58 family)
MGVKRSKVGLRNITFKLTKRKVGFLALLAVVTFYTFGTGFAFFFRLLYILLLLLGVGLAWAWLNLRGLEVRLTRLANRGQVGGYLEGQIQVVNRNRLPKSWLEVKEVSDLPDHAAGRGIGLVKDQSRTWRIQTYLARRGVFEVGQVEVTSQDPFGLFRLSRRFLSPQHYTVLPATHPLPDLDPRLANLPSDSRVNRRSDHITPDSSTVRDYSYGDSFRRIHWPYTARMNRLMVKEFDQGISAEAWVLLDMYRSSHTGNDEVDNTEELAVTVAASLVTRLFELSMPVGLAANGEQAYVFRPDSSPAQLGKLMDALAMVQARGSVSLERFIYDLRPNLSRFNTLTVITPSRRTEWIPALSRLRRQGVNVSAIYIDPVGFGAPAEVQSPLEFLFMNEIDTYMVKRGQAINEALRAPLQDRFSTPTGQPSTEEVTA